MAKSFSQNYQHIIFGVKYREAVLDPKYDDELHKFITGLVKNRNSYLIAINNVADHIHIFVDLNRNYSIAKFVQEIKALSSKFINEKQWYKHRFEWQGGYGAFSISYSDRGKIIDYIMNQKQHHKRKTFAEEYLEILQQFNIEIDADMLFKPLI